MRFEIAASGNLVFTPSINPDTGRIVEDRLGRQLREIERSIEYHLLLKERYEATLKEYFP